MNSDDADNDRKKGLWDSLEALVASSGDRLERFISRRSRRNSPYTERDVLHELYLRLLESSLEGVENPEAYLQSAARNLMTDFAGKLSRDNEWVIFDDVESDSYTAVLED